jgi:hypothetical protein
MPSYAARKAEADAHARRLGTEFGLGRGLDRASAGAAGCGPLAWGALALVIAVPVDIAAVARIITALTSGHLTGVVAIIVWAIALLVALPFTAIGAAMVYGGLRRRRLWLYRYEGGIALVGEGAPRAMRWDDLASITLSVTSGTDDDAGLSYISSCTLRSRQGDRIWVSNQFYDFVIPAAEQRLAYLAGPLIQRYDDGLPVTVSSVTVDRSGISSAGDAPWRVSWREVRQLETRLSGHQVIVRTGRPGYLKAALTGGPENGFLARHAIEHAARRAGVPVHAG